MSLLLLGEAFVNRLTFTLWQYKERMAKKGSGFFLLLGNDPSLHCCIYIQLVLKN